MNRSELRYAVLARDGRCVLASVRRDHRCKDQWGEPHDPDDIDRLTLEHVREHPGGKRRDEPGWCVAMCHFGNVNHEGSTTENRALINAYLVAVRRLI